MPLYCPAYTLWCGEPTVLEYRYYLPDLPQSGSNSGLLFAFFPGVGTGGYSYSVSMPELRIGEAKTPFTFNKWFNGVTVSSRGVWSDAIPGDVTVSFFVRIVAVFEGWVPLFSYGKYAYEVYGSPYWKSYDSLDPFPMAVVGVADLSGCYPGNLPDRPIITPYASRYTTELLSKTFDETPELNLNPGDSKINWGWWAETVDTSCGWPGTPWLGSSGCLRYQNGAITYVSSDDVNPVYLGWVGTDISDVFENESAFWALECTFEYDLNATPGQLAEIIIGNGYGRPEDSGPGYAKIGFVSSSGNKYFIGTVWTWNTGQISTGTAHGSPPNKYSMRMEYNGDKTFNFFWQEGEADGEWTAFPGNPYSRPTYAPNHTANIGLGHYMINYAGAISLLSVKVEYTAVPVYSYSGGYCQYDLSKLQCLATGFNFYLANQTFVYIPSVIISAYQSNNERADLELPMLTVSTSAYYAWANLTLGKWTCGAWESGVGEWGLCVFKALTCSASDVDAHDANETKFTAVPFHRTCEAYGFIQGQPDDIADDYKPKLILTNNEVINELADEVVFWGVS